MLVKRVLAFLKPYKFPIVIAYSLTFIELIIELLLPLFLGLMINDGIMNRNMDNIIMWGSIMLGLTLLAFICGIINSFYASHASNRFAYDIREKLFEKILSFSLSQLQRFPTSGLVTRFTNDVRQVQNTIYMALRIMTRAPLMVIGGVIMAFIVNAKLAAIFLVTVPLLVLFMLWVLRKASTYFHRVQNNVDGVNQLLQENLAGMRLIKAFVRRVFEIKRFTKANEELADSTRFTFRFVESSTPILLFVMNLSLIFILWFGNKQIMTGETSVGDVVTIGNYALRIAMSISMFSFIIMAFARAKASSDRLSEVLAINEKKVQDRAANPDIIKDGKIDFKNVSFTYPNMNQQVLQDISFSINAREKIAVLGATGSGKSTLFQLIPRLYDIKSGEIFIDDKDIQLYDLEDLRSQIGYVPQNPLLFSGSVTDNIVWGKKDATKEEVIQAAEDAQIHETIMALPEKYETVVSQKGVNLSGGQKQRISVARALIRRPKILMLDDSTSALDIDTESRLLDAIERDHCTTLIITQKIATAMRADRIILLDKGKVLAIGTHEELMKDSKLYYQIVESQFGKELRNVY